MQVAALDLSITSFFAGVLALFYVKLTRDVLMLRQKKKVPVGNGGDEDLARALMAHENFSFNSLFFLLMMALAEISLVSSYVLVIIGLFFMFARVIYSHSIKVYEKQKKVYGLRALGVMVTFGCLVALAAINLYIGVF